MIAAGTGGVAHAQEGPDEARSAPGPGTGEAVMVVDLRPPGTAGRADTREAFVAALDADARVRLEPEDQLLAALLHGAPDAGVRAALAPARAELARVDVLRRGGDCHSARPRAEAVIHALAEVQAGLDPGAQGPVVDDVIGALRAGYGHVLACAHTLGHIDQALLAAQRLHGMPGPAMPGPPPGVSEDVWRGYPAVDATANAHMVELSITTEPAGAQVWVDHRPVGAAPVTVLVSEGAHLVAAAGADVSGSQQAQVRRDAVAPAPWGAPRVMSVRLALEARAHPWRAEAARVAAWRRAGAVDPVSLGALMTRLDVRFAVVIPGSGPGAGGPAGATPGRPAVQLWALAPGQAHARRVGTGRLERPAAIAARVRARAARWDRGGPEPGVPLLREEDVPQRYGPRKGRRVARRPWWAYMTIIGAVTATSLLILAAELGDDRQRIELRWP